MSGGGLKKSGKRPSGGEIVGDGGICSELPGMWAIAWPTCMSALCRSMTQQITMILIGHEGARELGAVAMGNVWVSVTGMAIVFGGMSSLDTLASQAYGAENWTLVGLWTQRAIVIILLLCVPFFYIWYFHTQTFLSFIGIEPDIAAMAQDYTRVQCMWMLPVFMNRCLQSFWRAQRIVKPYTNGARPRPAPAPAPGAARARAPVPAFR